MPTIAEAPHPDQHRDGEIAVLQLHDERRIGRRDQEIDRRMIEAAQHPFGARHRPEIIGRRQHQHRQQARDIDRHRGDIDGGGIDGGQYDQRGGGDQAKTDADDMHDAIGNQLGAVVVPVHGAGRRMEGCRGELFQSEDRHADPPDLVRERLRRGNRTAFNATAVAISCCRRPHIPVEARGHPITRRLILARQSPLS